MSVYPFCVMTGAGQAPTDAELAVALDAMDREVRKRGQGGQPRFVAQLFWPFFTIGHTAVIDGLGLFSARLDHLAYPHVERLATDLKAKPSNVPPRELEAALRQQRKLLGRPPEASPYTVSGWATERPILRALGGYSPDPQGYVVPPPSAVLSARTTADAALAAMRTLPQLFGGASQADIEGMFSAVTLVRQRGDEWQRELDVERLLLAERLGRHLEELRQETESEIDALRESTDRDISALEERFGPELAAHEAEATRWEELGKGWREKGPGHEASLAAARKARQKAEGRIRVALGRRDRERARMAKRCAAAVERAWARIGAAEERGRREILAVEEVQRTVGRLCQRLERDLVDLAKRAGRRKRVGRLSALLGTDLAKAEIGTVYVPVWVAMIDSGAKEFMVLPPRELRPRGPFGLPLLSFRGRGGTSVAGFSALLRRRLEDALYTDAALQREIEEKGLGANVLSDPATMASYERGHRYLVERHMSRVKLDGRTRIPLLSAVRGPAPAGS